MTSRASLFACIGLCACASAVVAAECDCTQIVGTCQGGARIVSQEIKVDVRDTKELHWVVELNAGATAPQCALVKGSVKGLGIGIAGANADRELQNNSIYERVVSGGPVRINDYQRVRSDSTRVELGDLGSCQVCAVVEDPTSEAKKSDGTRASDSALQTPEERMRAAVARAQMRYQAETGAQARRQNAAAQRLEDELLAAEDSYQDAAAEVLSELALDAVNAAARSRNGARTPTTILSSGAGGAGAGAGGESCRNDPAMISRVEAIFSTCPASTQTSICGISRAADDCWGRVADAAASCPSVAAQARDQQRQYREQAARVCGP